MISFWIYKVNSTDKNITPKKFMKLITDVEDELLVEKVTTPEEKQNMSNKAFERAAQIQELLKNRNK